MAAVDTLNNPNDPNNPNAAPNATQQAPQGTNQPATTGGAGAVTATGAGNIAGQVVGTNNPAQPFQNISSYLAANGPQSQQLAGQVASTVSQPITQAQDSITKAADTFTGAVKSGFTPENKDLISAVGTNPSYVVNENPQNVDNFLAQLHNTYTGPTDFTQSPGYSDIEAKIANAQGQAKATQTPEGIQTLLNSVEGPTTAGINKLDSLLLTNRPENLSAIQAAGAPAAALPGTLTNTATAQNDLASQGAKTASSTAANAAAALQKALSGETSNLSSEQDTIQGIVNSYNQSVGVINPVTQTIAQDIQNFLAANPQLSLSDATSALAPLMNLNSISMPGEATYASPFDYQTIAALAKLGIDPSALSGLPITSATADQAQSFKLPQQLQDAIGQAPGVESALNTELNSLGGQIQTDVAPFTNAQNQANQGRETFKAITGNIDIYSPISPQRYPTLTDPATGQKVPATIQQKTVTRDGPVYKDLPNPAYQKLVKQAEDGIQVAEAGDAAMGATAPGLQWVNKAAPAYNDLIAAINAQLGKLGSVGVPTLNYGPNTVTDPITGAPIGAPVGKDIGNAAGIATGAGAGAAGTTAALSAAEAAAAGVPGAFGEGLATSGAPEAATFAEAGQGIASGLQMAGPAALAAYGTSNVVQNSLKNPVEAGIMTLANTGLSLATLSLPPQIFQSIGKEINNVINSIGDFFGGLF